MSGTHPSDEVLQRYALERDACAGGEADHIGNCADCQKAVAAYRVLAAELKDQPVPAFNFDLAAAVITQLELAVAIRPVPQKRRRRNEGAALTAALIVLAIGVPAWLFRRSAYFVFTDMSTIFYGVMLVTASLVVGLFLLRLHKKYQDVINLINK